MAHDCARRLRGHESGHDRDAHGHDVPDVRVQNDRGGRVADYSKSIPLWLQAKFSNRILKRNYRSLN